MPTCRYILLFVQIFMVYCEKYVSLLIITATQNAKKKMQPIMATQNATHNGNSFCEMWGEKTATKNAHKYDRKLEI